MRSNLIHITKYGLTTKADRVTLEALVMPQTPPNKKALLNEQGFGFRPAAASYFSVSNLSSAISMACVLPLIAGAWSLTYLSRALSNRSGSLIAIGVRVKGCLVIGHLAVRQPSKVSFGATTLIGVCIALNSYLQRRLIDAIAHAPGRSAESLV